MTFDPEVVRRLLRYCPEAGKLFWRERTEDLFSDGRHSAAHICARWNKRYAGQEAFTALDNGYRKGAIFNNPHRAHRVIWAIQTGEFAKGFPGFVKPEKETKA